MPDDHHAPGAQSPASFHLGGPLTVDDLLASPRGRSLVLNLVTSGESPDSDQTVPFAVVSEAMHRAVCVLDRQRGIDSAVYGGDDGETHLRNVQPTEVAQALRSLDPVPPTQTDLEHAMVAVIAGAMYWQPPHSDAVLAEDPEMVDALGPWAEAVVDSGLLETWSRGPHVDDQWELTWDDPPNRDATRRVLGADPTDLLSPLGGVEPSLPTDEAATSLAQWRAEVMAEEESSRRAYRLSPFDVGAGEWWSTPAVELWSTTGTWPSGEPIGLGLVEDDFGLERARARRVRLRDTSSVFTVSGPEQWAALCRRFPLDLTAQRREVWFEATGRKGRWVIPDWSRVAEQFDGIHVSLAGYVRTAGVVIDVSDESIVDGRGDAPFRGNTDCNRASLMAGWNPDTTYWLTDAISGITEVVDWSFDDDAYAWVAHPAVTVRR